MDRCLRRLRRIVEEEPPLQSQQEGTEQGQHVLGLHQEGVSTRLKNTKEGSDKYSGVERLNVMKVSILQKSVRTFCKTPLKDQRFIS